MQGTICLLAAAMYDFSFMHTSHGRQIDGHLGVITLVTVMGSADAVEEERSMAGLPAGPTDDFAAAARPAVISCQQRRRPRREAASG